MSDEQNAALIALEKELDASINVVELEDDIRLAFEKLDPETDAVYISDLGVRSKDEIRSLADQLIIKGLPSFSSNKWHVDQGIMACMAADNSFDQIMRKLGVMVDEALAGKPLSENGSQDNLFRAALHQ
jgi:maleate cis-trans isomerase